MVRILNAINNSIDDLVYLRGWKTYTGLHENDLILNLNIRNTSTYRVLTAEYCREPSPLN